MPADPFRLRVMKAITDQLKTVTPQNGYEHDLSDTTDEVGRTVARVVRGRMRFGSTDPLPMIALLEDPRAIESDNARDGSSNSVNKLRVLVQGFVKDEPDNQLDPAYQLSADAIAALVKAKEDRFNILGMDGLITAMTFGQPAHRPGMDETSDHAYFVFGITLTMLEDLERPRGE